VLAALVVSLRGELAQARAERAPERIAELEAQLPLPADPNRRPPILRHPQLSFHRRQTRPQLLQRPHHARRGRTLDPHRHPIKTIQDPDQLQELRLLTHYHPFTYAAIVDR
jgi:hypothetical protein